jgi:dimethylargininase
MHPDWIDAQSFGDLAVLRVAEPDAGDVLGLPDPAATGAPAAIIMAASFPRTRDLLIDEGYHVTTVDVSELQKAEAGVTCMSVVFGGRE